MDSSANSQGFRFSKTQGTVLVSLLCASLIGNGVLIGNASKTPEKPKEWAKKEDIEVKGTFAHSRSDYSTDPIIFEGTVTNTSKADAGKVVFNAVFSAFLPKHGGHMVPGSCGRRIDEFRNLRAGETRSFRFVVPILVPKYLVIGEADQMYDKDDQILGFTPKIDWEVFALDPS